MYKSFLTSTLIMTLTGRVLAASDATSDLQVYHITPNPQVIEYRAAFAREHKETTVNHYGNYASGFRWSLAQEKTVTKNFPAGLYYVGANTPYKVPVGRHIVYSVVDEGPHGEARRVLVWWRVSKVDAEVIARDTESHRDGQFRLTAALAVIAGGLKYWLGRTTGVGHTYKSSIVVGAIAGIIGYYGYPHWSETRFVDQKYLPEASQKSLIAQMKAAGDDRVGSDRPGNVTVDGCSYALEAILDISHRPSQGGAHIDHFIIQKLSEKDAPKVASKVVQGNHAAHGALGYKLPNKLDTYSEDKEKLTLMASIRRMFNIQNSENR